MRLISIRNIICQEIRSLINTDPVNTIYRRLFVLEKLNNYYGSAAYINVIQSKLWGYKFEDQQNRSNRFWTTTADWTFVYFGNYLTCGCSVVFWKIQRHSDWCIDRTGPTKAYASTFCRTHFDVDDKVVITNAM